MAIPDFVGLTARNKIGFVGEEPPVAARKVLEELGGYELYRFEEPHMTESGQLATTSAVIFRQAANKPKKVLHDLKRYAGALLWNDCRVFVETLPATPGGNGTFFRAWVVKELNELKLPPSGLSDDEAKGFPEHLGGPRVPARAPWIHVLDRPGDWRDVAVLLRNNPPGHPPQSELTIDATDSAGHRILLTSEQDILLRRAFWNCSSIRLVGLKNGLSNVLTFRAFAHLREDAVGGKTPFLYFVKIGERAIVSKEYTAYCENALEHIPYHLGPRLRQSRCALGHTQGIIVGDFVAGAEPLRDCARDGRAVPVIANLFNSTLRAWHHGARREERSLQELLSEELPLEIPTHRQKLVDRYGAKRSPEELRRLFMLLDSRPVRVGVVHGDLHATNVLVRNQDAIVIDFEKVETRAPLLRDMASLEGGLFVDGFIGDRRTWQTLLKSVECLYVATAFEDTGSIHCPPSDGSAWFFDCVRQIRMQATQVEIPPRQYALALAVALMRKSCNKIDFSNKGAKARGLSRESVRALAYLLAERILVGLSGGGRAHGTKR